MDKNAYIVKACTSFIDIPGKKQRRYTFLDAVFAAKVVKTQFYGKEILTL